MSLKPSFSFQYDGKPVSVDPSLSTWVIDDALTVTLCATQYRDFNACEWRLVFENHSDHDSAILSDIWDCDIVLPFPPNAQRPHPGLLKRAEDRQVVRMQGMVSGANYSSNDIVSAQEYSLHPEVLNLNKPRHFENIGGRSSDGTMPFFEVKSGGRSAMVAIGWTGNWKAVFTSVEDGIRVQTGLQNACFYLKPGESLRTSSTLVMISEPGEDVSNRFRRLIRDHISHYACTPANREGLLAFELWGGLPSGEMIHRLKQLHEHDIRLEDVWIDAGWYGQCTKCDEPFSGDWSRFTGEWTINPRVHPNLLQDVAKTANDIGMKLMLWIEAERACPGLPVPEQHPEWFLSCDTTKNKILYYGNEDAFQYMLEVISNHIKSLKLSCYRQDFNTNLTDFFRQNDEPNRVGITEISHITGMYRLWDELLKRFPGLVIDNCSSGGRRIDIETIRRSIPFFRSDYQCGFDANAEVIQTHNSNISRYLPFNGCTTKCKDLYSLRSSYSSSFGGAFYNAVFQSMTEEDFATARHACDEYRAIRHYLSKDFYNHGSIVFDATSWVIWQFHDPSEGRGVILAFRRSQSPFERAEITLKGLAPQPLHYICHDDGTKFDAFSTIMLDLPEKRSSLVLEYGPPSFTATPSGPSHANVC